MNNKAGASERAVHGALDFAELARLNLSPDDILDFSVNANPYGPSPSVHKAIADAVLDRYPDRVCLQLRWAILRYELSETNLALASVVCGNDASELIWTVARTFLKPDAKAAIIGPTFGEYHAASRVVGAFVSEQRNLHVVLSRTHFCLIEFGDAQQVHQKLFVRRLLVRDCSSFGLPQYIRVATRPAHDWRRLLALLPEVL